ncbi:MAG: hypothetical protein KKB13_09690 [Chloroflexi bacterium]|nr:hypothetical protein [Chloroflexota bacterium]MBU1880308.1 hypothetical protein [Chloroflexota bacterium]
MNRSKSALRLLVPNVGTILVVALMMALMLLTQRTWAGPAAQGSTSGVMNYQGYLTNATGQPLTGSVEMSFRLYPQADSLWADRLWVENHIGANAVPVNNGLFNVWLGSLTPIPDSVWNQESLFLGVKMGSDVEMTPREAVGRVPYAMTAGHALTADLATAATQLDAPDGDPMSAVTVDNNGNVRVGASDRSTILTTQGITPTILLNHGGGAAEWGIRANGESFEIYEEDQAGDPVTFYISNGNQVGIGTTNPQAKLDVNGTIKVKGSALVLIKRFENIGNDANLDTGIPIVDWECVAAGWEAQYDVDEGDSYVNRVWTYVNSGTSTWWLTVQFASEGGGSTDHESPDVDLLCFRKEIAAWQGAPRTLNTP